MSANVFDTKSAIISSSPKTIPALSSTCIPPTPPPNFSTTPAPSSLTAKITSKSTCSIPKAVPLLPLKKSKLATSNSITAPASLPSPPTLTPWPFTAATSASTNSPNIPTQSFFGKPLRAASPWATIFPSGPPTTAKTPSSTNSPNKPEPLVLVPLAHSEWEMGQGLPCQWLPLLLRRRGTGRGGPSIRNTNHGTRTTHPAVIHQSINPPIH